MTLLLLLAMTAVVLYVNHKLVVPNVIVPKVIGQTEADARKMLNDRGLEVDPNIIRAYKPDVREGIVYNQSRSEGTEVKKGSLVQLSVGSAKPLKKMPDLKTLPVDDAIKKLIDQGFKEDNIDTNEENSDKFKRAPSFPRCRVQTPKLIPIKIMSP